MFYWRYVLLALVHKLNNIYNEECCVDRRKYVECLHK